MKGDLRFVSVLKRGPRRVMSVTASITPSRRLKRKIIHDARHPRYPGLKSAEIGLDFHKLIEQKDDIIHGYRKKKYESLTGGQFTIEKGHVEFVDDYTVRVDGKRLTGEKILIATGSRSVIPEIGGLRDVLFLTSDLLMTTWASVYGPSPSVR